MPITRYVTEVCTHNFGCDLCGGPGATPFVYATQSATERQDTDTDLTSTWIEAEWDVCAICGGYLDTGNQLALVDRMERLREYAPVGAKEIVDRLTGRGVSKRRAAGSVASRGA